MRHHRYSNAVLVDATNAYTAHPNSTETLKFTPLQTLLTLAQKAGFEIVGQYQDWHLEPLKENPAACVLELRKPD